MGIAGEICVGLFVLIILRFWRKILDRCRLIYYLSKIPSPISVPILGHTWMMKFKMSDLMIQLLEWGNFKII